MGNLEDGKSSIENICQILQEDKVSITKQGLEFRFTEEAAEYMKLMYNEALLEYNDAMLAYADAQTAAEEFLSTVGEITQEMLASLAKLREMSEAGNEWANIMLMIAEIKISLNGVLAQVKTLATKEQVAQITAMLQEMNEDLDWYIAVQDFDYDGVLIAFDKCPDTPITEINNVNADGCAPGETPVSDD